MTGAMPFSLLRESAAVKRGKNDYRDFAQEGRRHDKYRPSIADATRGTAADATVQNHPAPDGSPGHLPSPHPRRAPSSPLAQMAGGGVDRLPAPSLTMRWTTPRRSHQDSSPGSPGRRPLPFRGRRHPLAASSMVLARDPRTDAGGGPGHVWGTLTGAPGGKSAGPGQGPRHPFGTGVICAAGPGLPHPGRPSGPARTPVWG